MSVARFWRKIPQRYNMIGTRCATCGTCFFPPRLFCPTCRRAGKIGNHRLSGKGTVVTFTIVRTASEAFENMTPYVLAIVELEEGPRMTGQVVCSPEEIRIGMRVRPVFRRIGTDGPSGVISYGTKFAPE